MSGYGGDDNAMEANLNLNEDAIRLHNSRMEGINQNQSIFCIECGVEISVERRKAIPNADFCISCQELEDLRDKKFAKHVVRDRYVP